MYYAYCYKQCQRCTRISFWGGGCGIYTWGDWNPSSIIRCNDVWGNGAADYCGSCPDFTGTEGNISADPMLCDPGNGDFRLRSTSPCVIPQLDPACGDYIGAFGVGCGAVAVTPGNTLPSTWGTVKSRFER